MIIQGVILAAFTILLWEYARHRLHLHGVHWHCPMCGFDVIGNDRQHRTDVAAELDSLACRHFDKYHRQ